MRRFQSLHQVENLDYILMDTRDEGKYILGFTVGEDDLKDNAASQFREPPHAENKPICICCARSEKVSAYWHNIDLPEFQISNPVLGNTHYYGEIVDHKLIQGWQRHGTIAYEWCIPIKPPIVYQDHINKHGEGIHHLAFSVADMDKYWMITGQRDMLFQWAEPGARQENLAQAGMSISISKKPED